jgi:hypothetical protein
MALRKDSKMKIKAVCNMHKDAKVLFLEASVRGTLDGNKRDLESEYYDSLWFDEANMYCSVSAENHDIVYVLEHV